jgi:hypothetical protein
MTDTATTYSYSFGVLEHIVADKPILQTLTRTLLGEDAMSAVKDSFSQEEDCLAWHINLKRGTIRPKNKALGKLTFLMFVFDDTKPQAQAFWQCLTSLTHYYAKAVKGMEAFLAPISRMIHYANTGRKQAVAKPQTRFAIEMWRVALYMMYLDPTSLDIPLDLFYQQHGPRTTSLETPPPYTTT